jgi:hypothetical protein
VLVCGLFWVPHANIAIEYQGREAEVLAGLGEGGLGGELRSASTKSDLIAGFCCEDVNSSSPKPPQAFPDAQVKGTMGNTYRIHNPPSLFLYTPRQMAVVARLFNLERRLISLFVCSSFFFPCGWSNAGLFGSQIARRTVLILRAQSATKTEPVSVVASSQIVPFLNRG